MITAPKVLETIEPDTAKKNLQTALNMIAQIATVVGDASVEEAFRSALLRNLATCFTDIDTKLIELASDDIPF